MTVLRLKISVRFEGLHECQNVLFYNKLSSMLGLCPTLFRKQENCFELFNAI